MGESKKDMEENELHHNDIQTNVIEGVSYRDHNHP